MSLKRLIAYMCYMTANMNCFELFSVELSN